MKTETETEGRLIMMVMIVMMVMMVMMGMMGMMGMMRMRHMPRRTSVKEGRPFPVPFLTSDLSISEGTRLAREAASFLYNNVIKVS